MAGWGMLGDMKRENERAEEEATRAGPSACPIDGSVLRVRGKVRDCPMGNYRWEG